MKYQLHIHALKCSRSKSRNGNKLTCTPLDWTLHHRCSGKIFPLVKKRVEKLKAALCTYSFHQAVTAYLKELHSDTGEHELQQCGDNHDVTDGPDGHEDTLDHVLQKQAIPRGQRS